MTARALTVVPDVAPVDTDALVDRYTAALEQKPLSKHTKRAYKTRVKAFLQADMPGSDWNARVYNYAEHLLKDVGAKPATVNLALAAIDDYLRTIGQPCHTVDKQQIVLGAPKALERLEIRHLKAELEKEPVRNRVIVMLMLDAGLRLSEVVALKREDVPASARTGSVIVRCGKGNKHRTIKMTPELRSLVIEYLQDKPGAGSDPLLIGKDGSSHLGTNAVVHLVRTLGDAAGIDGLHPHRLRHTCLTRLARNGVDLALITHIAGHASSDTTRRYTQPTESDIEREMTRAAER